MTEQAPSNPPALSPRLTQTEDDLKTLFRRLSTAADVAALLEVRESQLTYAIWRVPTSKRYHTWAIKKRRGGVREIDAPAKTLKILQRKLATILNLVAQRRSAVHGFTPKKSIVTNAAIHVRSNWVLTVDLKDFFPSIHFGRVRGMLVGKPYLLGERAATALAQLCCYKGRLPQGAPSSPIITNMICAKLDGELRRLAGANGCKYTRYVDDLTFSTRRVDFPPALATFATEGPKAAVGSALRDVIQGNGFEINAQKVRLQSRHTRQQVTGLVVNRRPNVQRKYVSQIRAMIHAWESYGYERAQAEFLAMYDSKHRLCDPSSQIFERVIRGKLAFLRHVRGEQDRRYAQLSRCFRRLTGDVTCEIIQGVEMEYDVFVCHAKEDKEQVVVPLVKELRAAGFRVWFDEDEIGWGTSVTGAIDEGLAKSRFVLVVLSDTSHKKEWVIKEMRAALSQEIASKSTRVLPLIVGDEATKKSIFDAFSMMRDKRYLEWCPGDNGPIIDALKSIVP